MARREADGSGPTTSADAGRLRLSEARFRTLFEHAPEAQVVLDADAGNFVEVNAQAEALFGYHRNALLQMGPASLSPPTQPDGRLSRDVALEHIERALAGETPRFEWVHQDALGRDILCELRLVRLPAVGQRLIRGSITDITERRRLEEEVHQSRKMEAIGQLAGGIAHDFNNVLTVINSYAELALKDVDPRGELASYLREIRKSGQRAASLTAQLLAFGRKQVIQPRVIDINRVAGDLLEMMRRVIGANIELVTELSSDLRPIEVDLGQLEQIVINLVVNARDAMPEGGVLTIATRDDEIEPGFRALPQVQTTRFSVISISDTGTGIAEEVQEHMFEPFFTTKSNMGTGLGLSTVYGIVEQNAGFIRVDSAAGKGATFDIWLPSTERQVPDETPLPEHVVRGHETLLLVEDEESVRELVVSTLGSYGYEVLEAPNANAALDVVSESSREIHMVITDVIMPGMTGLELSARLTATHPDTAVLLISGYTDELIPPGTLRPGVSFLSKPFTPDLLARKVRQLLDDGR